MKIDYAFEDLHRAVLAKEMLKGKWIYSTLSNNVLLSTKGIVVHRLDVDEDDAQAAEAILNQFGLMGKG